MFMRSKTVLLSAATFALLVMPAAAEDTEPQQRVPRIVLDWEPVPSDSSQPIVRRVGGQSRIVGLRGGKRIRVRAQRTK